MKQHSTQTQDITLDAASVVDPTKTLRGLMQLSMGHLVEQSIQLSAELNLSDWKKLIEAADRLSVSSAVAARTGVVLRHIGQLVA